MKNHLSSLALATVLCLTSVAFAADYDTFPEGYFGTYKPLAEMTQDEFNLWCTTKTDQEYVAEYLNPETWETEYTVLPAGTYCSVSSTVPGRVIIRYMADGELKQGIIPEDGIISCVSSYRDGVYARNVHELDPNHDQLLQTHPVSTLAESVVLYGTTDYSNLNFENPENWEQGTAAYQAAQLTAGRTPENAAQTNIAIQTVSNGSTQSSSSADVHTTVQSSSLSADVPVDHRTASVYAPQSGTALMRKEPRESSYVTAYCETGTLVTVLQYGSTYCCIRY